MKRLKTVFNFEFNELIRKKSMLISTVVVALILLVGTFVPRIISYFDNKKEDDSQAPTQEISFDHVVVATSNDDLLEYVESIFKDYDGIEFSLDESDAIEKVKNDYFETAFIMESETAYKVVKKDSGLDFSEDAFENILREVKINQYYIEKGIDPEDVYEAQNIQLDVSYETLGRDATQGLVFGFVALFALYMLILMYGQLVATSVAREKDSRTMELLITSTNPKTLIIGKVLAAGLVGFIQVMFIIFIVYLGFTINKSTYPEMLIEMISGSTTLDVMLMYLVFSFSGYLLYLFIYAALGSLVSKVEDVGSAVSSITIIFVIAYLIASSAMGAPDTTLVRVSSYVPFVSLFTMPIRYMMTSVPTFDIVISLVLMAVVTILIAYLSIYIYRLGSLNYGNRMKLTRVVKGLFKKEKHN